MADTLIQILQLYVAISSVSASAVRGSPKDTAGAARGFLGKLQLRQFGVKHKSVFRQRLNKATEELRRKLPEERQDWALARKLLNIFLRNAFYNHYLREQYNLHLAESFFEVPVDSVVAKELRREFPKRPFGSWPGLKGLTKDEHTRYQDCAKELADKCGIACVHLDAKLWMRGR